LLLKDSRWEIFGGVERPSLVREILKSHETHHLPQNFKIVLLFLQFLILSVSTVFKNEKQLPDICHQ